MQQRRGLEMGKTKGDQKNRQINRQRDTERGGGKMQGGRMCEAREKKESRADSQHSQERQVRATDMSPETMCVCECVCVVCVKDSGKRWREEERRMQKRRKRRAAERIEKEWGTCIRYCRECLKCDLGNLYLCICVCELQLVAGTRSLVTAGYYQTKEAI